VRFPAAAPILNRLCVSTRPRLQNSAYSGQHGGSLPSFRGRGSQVIHLLCKQAHAGALPTDSTILRLEPSRALWLQAMDGRPTFTLSGYGLAGHFTAGNSTKAQIPTSRE